MKKDMVPLYMPYIPELPQIQHVLWSGRLTAGEHTNNFEEKLRNYFDTKYVYATGTFSEAIYIAVTTYGFQNGENVIASPMACLTSTQAFLALGLEIVWADIDPSTGTLDPDSVRKKVNSKTRFIVHNHFCGYPGYIDEINSIGRERGITVIDDGIECFGSKYHDKLIGNCGSDVTVFSFNPVRMLTTIDGGAVIFKDADKAAKSIRIRDCGIDRDQFRDKSKEINENYDITEKGFSATLSNVNGYIGFEQMKTVDERIEKHRKNARRWDYIFQDSLSYKPLSTVNGEPNYWVYGIRADQKAKCLKKFRDMGYYASGVHIKNNIYSVFGKQAELLGVNEFNASFVALPCGWWMENNFEINGV